MLVVGPQEIVGCPEIVFDDVCSEGAKASVFTQESGRRFGRCALCGLHRHVFATEEVRARCTRRRAVCDHAHQCCCVCVLEEK